MDFRAEFVDVIEFLAADGVEITLENLQLLTDEDLADWGIKPMKRKLFFRKLAALETLEIDAANTHVEPVPNVEPVTNVDSVKPKVCFAFAAGDCSTENCSFVHKDRSEFSSEELDSLSKWESSKRKPKKK